MDIGLDRVPRLEALLRRLRGQRVGLLAHAASVDRRLEHVIDVMAGLGVKPAILFAPEHGFVAAAQDMAPVDDERDPSTGALVVSLYGDEPAQLVPKTEHLQQLDVLVVDLVDVGARYYTFVWTALLAARAAATVGVHVVLLDRPNPLGGLARDVEGRTQRDGFLSFVGLEPVAIRHGLTIGELLVFHVARDGSALGPDGAVSVVEVRGWERAELAPKWDRPFVLPSPNMPTADTALVYPGGCLVEGTNLSEGRGLTRPFELIGAPWLSGERLAGALSAVGLTGFSARPVQFVPTFHKHAGERCGGVQIHPTDRSEFRPVATYVALIALARAQQPERFRFRTERYEFIDDIPAFDLLTGSDAARLAMEADADPQDVVAQVAPAAASWPETMAEAAQLAERAGW